MVRLKREERVPLLVRFGWVRLEMKAGWTKAELRLSAKHFGEGAGIDVDQAGSRIHGNKGTGSVPKMTLLRQERGKTGRARFPRGGEGLCGKSKGACPPSQRSSNTNQNTIAENRHVAARGRPTSVRYTVAFTARHSKRNRRHCRVAQLRDEDTTPVGSGCRESSGGFTPSLLALVVTLQQYGGRCGRCTGAMSIQHQIDEDGPRVTSWDCLQQQSPPPSHSFQQHRLISIIPIMTTFALLGLALATAIQAFPVDSLTSNAATLQSELKDGHMHVPHHNGSRAQPKPPLETC
jgi:hypothetical protein